MNNPSQNQKEANQSPQKGEIELDNPPQKGVIDMNYFKLYQSIFENETYVTELNDLQKVMYMLISSEMNRKEAASMTTGKVPVMKFSHYWLSSALSSPRNKVSKALKPLVQFGFFDYTRGYYVEGKGKKKDRSAPSTITNLAKEEFFVPIDRYTFEFLLYGKLKQKEIKYRHIVIYALCKYIEQFYGGAMTINEFGRKLGMTSDQIKYNRIKKPLEDLQAMNLITFQKSRGKIEGVTVHQLNFSRQKQFELREGVRIEAESLRKSDIGVARAEVAASAEEVPEATTLDDVITSVKDMYARQANKKAVVTAEHKESLYRLYAQAADSDSPLSVKEIHEYALSCFFEKGDKILQQGKEGVFSVVISHIKNKWVMKRFG